MNPPGLAIFLSYLAAHTDCLPAIAFHPTIVTATDGVGKSSSQAKPHLVQPRDHSTFGLFKVGIPSANSSLLPDFSGRLRQHLHLQFRRQGRNAWI